MAARGARGGRWWRGARGGKVAMTVAATAHGEVAASRSILDVAKCGIFVYIYTDHFQGRVEESPAPRNTLLGRPC